MRPQRPLKSSSRSNPATRCPRTCMTRSSVTRPSAERSLHHCSFRSENQRAEDKLITLLKKVSCQVSPCLSDCRAEIHKHEFQADSDRRSIQELSGIIDSQRREIDHTDVRDEQLRQDQQLPHEQLLAQNRDLREAHLKRLNEMKELKRFHGSTFDTIARRILVKIQELQNEIYCVNDSRDFQDAESVRSGHSHVASQPVFFPLHPDPGGMPSRSLGMPSRNDVPPSIWDTHVFSGNVFANPAASSSAPFPQELNPWVSLMYQNTHHHMWWVKAKHQLRIRDANQDRQPEIHSSQVRENFQRIMVQTNNDCRFQILILTNSTRFKTEACTCSQSPAEAVLWIKEVEMVNQWMISNVRVLSEEFKHQILKYSTRKLLQHWTESSIIPASRKGVSLEEHKEEDRLPGLRVLPGHWSQRFCRELCRPIYNCSSKWWYSGIRFGMGRNSIINDENPIWWHLGRIVQFKNTWVWETQDRIGIVQYGVSSEESRTWLSQIEDNGEKKYRAEFEAKNGNYETNAVVKNQVTKQREQRTPGYCWQWKTNGQCSKGDTCSFRHDINKRAKTTQPNPSPSSSTRQSVRNAPRTRSLRGRSPSGRMSRLPCKDYLIGTCTNSFCEKVASSRMRVPQVREWMQIWEKCSNAHRQVDEQPSKRSKKNGDKSAVEMLKSTRQLGCVFQDVEPPKSSSILRKSSDIRKPLRCVQFTKSRRTSCLHSRPKSIAWNDLPRWSSSA